MTVLRATEAHIPLMRTAYPAVEDYDAVLADTNNIVVVEDAVGAFGILVAEATRSTWWLLAPETISLLTVVRLAKEAYRELVAIRPDLGNLLTRVRWPKSRKPPEAFIALLKGRNLGGVETDDAERPDLFVVTSTPNSVLARPG